MPELDIRRHLGPKPPTTVELRGSVALFFFWAHWCGDCKIQEPILAKLHEKYASKGLRIIGPTRLYGFDGSGDAVSPMRELAYIKGPYLAQYPLPEWMSAPLSEKNFIDFGVSTTPTLVLADREGIVKLYHPGRMPEAELVRAIEELL